MIDKRAIVDTCFLEKISSEGDNADNIINVLDEIGFRPVAHPYVIEHEFGLKKYILDIIESGYIESVDYGEFLKDNTDRQMYEESFYLIYNELRILLKANGGKKQMPELNIPNGSSIYDWHISGSSMGDVHMILMASFMGIPVFITEDSDIDLLRDIVKRRLSIGMNELKIYDSEDLLMMIAEKTDTQITHKEFENIVKQTGLRKKWINLNKAWHDKHDDIE